MNDASPGAPELRLLRPLNDGTERWLALADDGATLWLARQTAAGAEPLTPLALHADGTDADGHPRLLLLPRDKEAAAPLSVPVESDAEPLALLRSADPDDRLLGAARLGRSGKKGAVEPLIAALRDGHPDVRRYAAEGLGRIGDTRAGAVLVGLLADPEPWVAQWAAGAMHRLGLAPRQHGYRGPIVLVDDAGEEQIVEE